MISNCIHQSYSFKINKIYININLNLKMDKITKVQEVSSFIVNFDNKYWNEVIIRLTIIGIRYVTNNYKNIFKIK